MKFLWTPDPYEAGIAITDDPDNSSFSSFKVIYDFLVRIRLPTTRSMWVYENLESTGTPHLPIKFYSSLLSNKACLEFCRHLHDSGFEICLHGASSGNNKRESTTAAIDFLESNIGHSDTFICHSKNAENPYWDHKCTPSRIIAPIVKLYSGNTCYGEEEASEYFWGDICRARIKYIRLFRTRMVNTLAFNPGMPYHDFRKPYVNYWFSATKGYLPNIINKKQLDLLCKSNGAGILYQYLHKYVDIAGNIKPEIMESLELLASDKRIMVKPVSEILNRLKQFHLLFFISYKDDTYIINASRKDAESIQLLMQDQDEYSYSHDDNIVIQGSHIIVKTVKAMSVFKIYGCRSRNTGVSHVKMHGNVAEIRFPLGVVWANYSNSSVEIDSRYQLSSQLNSEKKLEPFHVKVAYRNCEAERLEILNPISRDELYRIFFGQARILLREHVVLGRKLKVSEYLTKTGKVEDQANW
jgi:hypothetical protein